MAVAQSDLSVPDLAAECSLPLPSIPEACTHREPAPPLLDVDAGWGVAAKVGDPTQAEEGGWRSDPLARVWPAETLSVALSRIPAASASSPQKCDAQLDVVASAGPPLTPAITASSRAGSSNSDAEGSGDEKALCTTLAASSPTGLGSRPQTAIPDG